MKSVVLYHSKYGATKQYAHWIAKDLNCEALDSQKVNTSDLVDYDRIIFGGGIYMEKVIGLRPFIKQLETLKGKKVFIFAVGLSEQCDKTILRDMDLPFYYLRGRLNYQDLTLKDKILIQIFKIILKTITDPKKKQPTLFKAINEPVDYVKKENLKSILEALQTLEG